MATYFLTLRLGLVQSRSLDEAVLLKPTLMAARSSVIDETSCQPNDADVEDEEDRIELLESMNSKQKCNTSTDIINSLLI